MEMKPGYKQTEVGVIPEDWGIAELGTLAMIERGKFSARPRNDPQYYDGEYPFLQTGDVTRSGGRISSFTQTLNDRGLSVSKLFPSGTLFFTISANIGDVGIANFETACPDSLVAISPRGGAKKEWLLYELATRKDSFEALASPGTQLNLNLEKLRPFLLPVPPIPEQRAIATALSDTDALLDGLDRLIAKKRAIKQASLQQLLTGQTRLPGFNGKWEVARLGDIAWIEMGQSPDSRYYNRTGDGVPLIQGNADIEDRLTIARVWTTQVTKEGFAGDLLLTVRAPVGSVGKISEDCCLGRGVCSVRPRVDAAFLFHALVHSESAWQSLEQGSTFTSANSKQVAAFNLLIPVDSQEQAAIATILSDMDAEIVAHEARRTKTRALKQAMMQELLTGRTRLVTPDEKSDEEAVAQTEGRKPNVHFLRSVLAAEIIDQLHDQPTFGHVKFEKMMFLTEHLCEVDTGSTYHRKAAGPYDNRALRSIDSQLQKQQWFEARKQDGRYQYVPLAKRGGHKPYFERHFSAIVKKLEEILSTFKTAKTEQCEIVATLLAAWSDLLRKGGTVSDEMIVHEVLHNWHEAKQRIPEDRWLAALGWMREKGFVPKGATLP